jgi:16S rRNA processing protein RimM
MSARKKPRSAGSGSPATGEPEYLVVGSLRRAHGVHGEMVMEVITDFPERLRQGTQVFVGSAHTPLVMEGVRGHGEGLIIKLQGVGAPEEAARLRNQLVYVTAADRPPLPQGQFYEHELIGFKVVDSETNEEIGTLSEILRTGANDVYVVARPGGDEVLLPVIASVVLMLDSDLRVIQVRLLPGLLDGAQR